MAGPLLTCAQVTYVVNANVLDFEANTHEKNSATGERSAINTTGEPKELPFVN